MTYNEIKKLKESSNILGLSPMGYALICDYIFCNRFNYINGNYPNKIKLDVDNLKKLQKNNKLFLNGEILTYHIDNILNIFKENNITELIIFIHNVEPTLEESFIINLLPYAKKIYLVNKHIEYPNVYNLPIGIRDTEEVFSVHKHFSHNILINELHKNRVKDILCLLCFSHSHIDRKECQDILGSKDFILNYNNKKFNKQKSIHCGTVPVDINYEITHRSKYTLAPIGCGISTHRFYESLCFRSIPIVFRTPFYKYFEKWPVLIVDEWCDVTENLLLDNYDRLSKSLSTFNIDYPNWLYDANCLLELLEKT